jgi:hypothetical protein
VDGVEVLVSGFFAEFGGETVEDYWGVGFAEDEEGDNYKGGGGDGHDPEGPCPVEVLGYETDDC